MNLFSDIALKEMEPVKDYICYSELNINQRINLKNNYYPYIMQRRYHQQINQIIYGDYQHLNKWIYYYFYPVVKSLG